ncbi:hypothetical protein L3081_24965 [Colwellia sp. MSW7]|uniref:HTH araC/xylS-type domain-containing protein n=1 Tax=Colwellia maritima TaxID=2912588 RepID=A0ABS9X8G4_9GAMM|nr:hypothetical protein [Colwellia maritima]MCI2286077.1 hypothetical protein [Colwellia maritima]
MSIAQGLGNSHLGFNSQYARQFRELLGCKIAWREDWQMFAVKFNEGVGLVMPMKL